MSENDNMLLAVNAVGSLLTVGINALIAAQKYQAVIETARLQGRAVNADELAALAAETDATVAAAMAALDRAAKR